jgi:hypothetical protein
MLNYWCINDIRMDRKLKKYNNNYYDLLPH